MPNLITITLSTALLAIAFASSPALADGNATPLIAAEQTASFDQDRADILAMAGDYKVTFDMQETTSWRDDYDPIEAKISGGHESVRVIEDTGDAIVLQHLLVVGSGEESFVIKHWRQDWKYEPETMLVYAGSGTWKLVEVPADEREGRWSQVVYQVDDSPRYGGVGQWTSVDGVRRWVSDRTARPLARRDAVRDPVYDHYSAINRHQPMPGGWIHWQDNAKMKMIDGKPVPYVQESVLNTYVAFEGYNIAAADAYWDKTQDYWAAIRDEWDAAIARGDGVTVEEEAETGTVISARLLEMGTQVSTGEMTEENAIAEARTLLRDAVSAPATAMARNDAEESGY